MITRQANLDRSPFSRLAVDQDGTVGLPDESIDHRQAEPGALADWLGGVEWIESSRFYARRHSDAGVAHAQADIFAWAHVTPARLARIKHLVCRVYRHRAAVWHGVARIDREIQERVFELIPVAPDEPEILACSNAQIDILAERAAQQFLDGPDQLVEIQGTRIDGLATRERQQTVRQSRGAIGRLQSPVQKPVKVADPPFGDPSLDDIESAENPLKEIIEVVSDAAGELPHGFHLLALAQRFLGLHQLASTLRHALFKGRVDVSQRLRGDLLVLDIGVAADPAQDDAVSPASGKRASEMPTIHAVRASDPKLRFIRRASRERRLPKLGGGRHIVGMNKGAPPIAVERSGLRAAVFVNALVEPIELTVRPRCPDVVGHRLRERTKLRFAGSQDFLRHASFVHVAKNGGDEHARLAFPARERHFEIARRAILASRHHFDWLAHGVTVEDRASRLVPRRAILEKQRGRLADQFFRQHSRTADPRPDWRTE